MNMSISQIDTRILNIAYQAFVTKEFALKLFSKKHTTAGFEAWAVGELLVQFEIRGLNPKKMKDPDIVANGINIELKATAFSKNSRSAGWLIDDYEDHPIHDRLHLFIFSYNESVLRHLIYFLLKNNITCQLRKLFIINKGPQFGWMVMISRKTKITPKKAQIDYFPYTKYSQHQIKKQKEDSDFMDIFKKILNTSVGDSIKI